MRCCYAAFVLLGSSALALLGCDHQPENPLTQPEKFAEVYVALLKAAEHDSLSPAAADSIVRAFGYDQGRLQEAAQYYREHAELWHEVLSKAVQQLEREVNAPAADSLVARPSQGRD